LIFNRRRQFHVKHLLTAEQHECLHELCRDYATVSTEQVLRQGGVYIDRLLAYNRAVPLISRAGDQRMLAVGLFLSSMAVLEFLPVNTGITVCDLGSGGGFPAIPLKIARPDIRWILLESRQRKCAALESIIRELSFTDISVVCGRFEEYTPSNDARCQIITSRAGPAADKVFSWAGKLTALMYVVLFETPADCVKTEETAGQHGFHVSARKEVDLRLNIEPLLILQFKTGRE
jgi:16S rRNA (guanine(527)-N(7))-methyltransferase RsmG